MLSLVFGILYTVQSTRLPSALNVSSIHLSNQTYLAHISLFKIHTETTFAGRFPSILCITDVKVLTSVASLFQKKKKK